MQDRWHVLKVFYELATCGIIVPGGGPQSASHLLDWPFFWITEYGRRVLESVDYVPHDKEGYVGLLRKQIPSVDNDIIRYMDESLECFANNLNLAAAVMLGCAAEKAVILLLDGFGAAISDNAKQTKYRKELEQAWLISKRYSIFWSRLKPVVSQLPRELQNDLEATLYRTFALIKETRNAAGHPSGMIVDKEAMHGNLILFPSFCRRVYSLIEFFAKNQIAI